MPQLGTLTYLAILLIGGLLCGRLVKLIKLPNVTGYLLAGLVLGPHVLKVIPADTVAAFDLISEMALAFIAFTIGLSFKRSYFKQVGKTPIVIAILEALCAVFFVQGALVLAGCAAPFAIVLGSIAAATAPAATIMVIKQYRAKGPVTDTLLAVVAIDDAVALVAFGLSVAVAGMLNPTAESAQASLVWQIAKPLVEILIALALGSAVGFLMTIPMRFFKKRGNRLIILCGAVFATSGIATLLGASELLACMMCGAILCNISPESDMMAELADDITPPIFLLFFATSGAGLDIGILPSIGVIGVVYVLVRVAGKMFGAWLGGKVCGAPSEVRKWLGPTLIPQAGVAIGLTIVAQSVVPQYAPEIRAVVLCGTLIYELVGPAVTKFCLSRAGEITATK